MAFDQTTRNRLQRFVNDARRVLEEEFTRQLQNDYGMDPNAGTVAELASLRHINDAQRETARILRDTLAHYTASGDMNAAQGLDRIVREQAFTVLNRLAALRMAEARGLLVESVGNGFQAKGFQLYARLAGTGLGETGDAYRVYLFSVFDELAQDLPGLFDRYSPQGRLFPREAALLQVLNLINDADIAPLWGQDETIGWIYQYFNSKEERKAMREASQAPRNSRELAVRNQFFTPRYVVEFLVDNTLGRLWYEATQGTSALRDRCQYLLCTPQDVFLRRFDTDDLRPGSVAALAQAGRWSDLPTFDTTEAGVQAMIEFAHCVNTYDRYSNDTWGDYFQRLEPALHEQRVADLSTQELWDGIFLVCRADRHGGDGSVYQERWFVAACQEIVERLKSDEPQRKATVIAHHPVRDPRTLKLLDPACGSMHFGLYAFDLFAEVYREAWAWEQQHGPGSLQVPADAERTAEYASKTALAQAGQARAAINTEANKAAPGAYAPLCQAYADEAALLRDVPRLIIEHNIYGVDIDPRAAQIASLALWLRAQRAWHDAGVKAKDRPLIGRGHVVAAIAPPAELELRQQFAATLDHLDAELFEKTLQLLKGLPELGVLLQVERELPHLIRQVFGEHGSLFKEADMEQWQKAEVRLRVALTEFAQAAQSNYQGRLFVQDALQGLRVIDLCREVFDVVVMNPPFGDAPESAKPYLKEKYSDWADNLYVAFHNRASMMLAKNGRVGAISSRTFITYRDFEAFRKSLINNGNIHAFADLGWGVLDGAQVETSAYVTSNASGGSIVSGPFIRILDVPLDEKKDYLLSAWRESKHIFYKDTQDFQKLPGTPLCYWSSKEFVESAESAERLYPDNAYVGLGASPHAFFFRAWWEVPQKQIGIKWKRITRGGDFSPFFRSNALVIDWQKNGACVKEYILKVYPYLKGNYGWKIQDEAYYEKPGITWGKRNERFNAQVMPAGHIFTDEGQGVVPKNPSEAMFLLGYLNSSFVSYFLSLTSGLQKHYVYIRPIPVVVNDINTRDAIEDATLRIVAIKKRWDATSELSPQFSPWQVLSGAPRTSLDDLTKFILERHAADCELVKQHRELIDRLVCESVALASEDLDEIATLRSNWPQDRLSTEGFLSSDSKSPAVELAKALCSYLMGVNFGRWKASGFFEGASSIDSDPFDVIASRPPAMNDPSKFDVGSIARIIATGDDFVGSIGYAMRQALVLLWDKSADLVEQEMLKALGVSTFEEYFGRLSGFFSDHLDAYSKNRRKAPIYWPLSTTSGSYTLWVYYPSLTSQTLYTMINDFVEPKLKQVGADVAALRNTGVARTRGDEKQFEALQDLELELIDLRDTLLQLAPTYKPHHDDGVQISAAPLWPLFRHKPWQKILKDTWSKLEKGEFDWAHLAMNYWPERVREKCKTDKSLAIAHGLEDLYVEPEAVPKKTRGRKKAGVSE